MAIIHTKHSQKRSRACTHDIGIIVGLLQTLLLASIIPPSACRGATAIVRQLDPGVHDTQLLDAFQNETVTTIILASDYAVGSQFDKYSGSFEQGYPVIPIHRNITITGLPGQQPVLDYQFKYAVLQLCDRCWFNMVNITVKDERMGANAWFDFFLGSNNGNSVIMATNVIRERRACTDSDTASKLVARTKRPERFLGPGGSQEQVLTLGSLQWRGRSYPNMLFIQDYAVDFPKHYTGGYIVVLLSVWRLCHTYAEPSCLLSKDADLCVSELMQQSLKADKQQVSAGGGALAPGVAAAVAVTVVMTTFTAAVLLWFLWRCKFSKRSRAQEGFQRDAQGPRKACSPELGPPKPGGSSSFTGSASCDQAADGLGSSLGLGGHTAICVQDNNATTQQKSDPAAGGSCGPQLTGSIANMRFGHVLGAGSFGRVYKAVWGNVDVAVKVIEHTTKMSHRVANEVSLMLSCQHPNVVCAYHYVTHSSSHIAQDPPAPTLKSTPATVLAQCSGSNSVEVSQGLNVPNLSSSVEPQSRCSLSSVDKPVPVLPGPKTLCTACVACDRESCHLTPAHELALEAFPVSSCKLSGSSAHHNTLDSFPASLSSSAAALSINPASTTSMASGRVGSNPCDEGVALGGCDKQGKPLECTCQQQSDPEVSKADPGESKWCTGGFWPAGPSALLEQQQQHGSEPGHCGGDNDEGMMSTWLIQEYCDSGTLSKQASNWLPDNEDDMQMLKRLVLLQDAIRGLSYLHSSNIVHGDVNARNVLVTKNAHALGGLTAKLADLGISRIIKQHNTHHTTCTVGTMSHMPPELLRHGHMSSAVDVYSFGIMMWEVFTGNMAFRELHYGQFFETVVLRDQRPPVPENMAEDYRVLMEHCWATDPATRPSANAVLECITMMISDRQHSSGLPEPCRTQHSQEPSQPLHTSINDLAALQPSQQQQHMVPHHQQRQPTPARLSPGHTRHERQQQHTQSMTPQGQSLRQAFMQVRQDSGLHSQHTRVVPMYRPAASQTNIYVVQHSHEYSSSTVSTSFTASGTSSAAQPAQLGSPSVSIEDL